MSDTRGERPVSLRVQVIGVAAALLTLGGVAAGVGVAAHNAQVQADASHAMTVAAPAYQGTIELGGSLDTLSVKSIQAKQAYDAEQARIAAEQAAQAAAAQVAAEQAAAQVAAEQAAAQQVAEQQAAQQQAAADTNTDPAPTEDPVPLIPTPGSADSGRYDTSSCGSAGANTNPDGSVTCAG